MSDVRMAVAGAAGRMGRALIRTIHDTDGAVLAGALEAAESPALDKDAGILAGLEALGVAVSADAAAAIAHCDVLVDFTKPKVSADLAELAARAEIAHVIGTTGFLEEEEERINAAAKTIPILKSGNMSVGICVLSVLVKQAAAVLPDFDIEIVEMHHNKKADAPSGTALMLGRAAAEGRGVALEDHMARGRDGLTGPRNEGEIGFAALRGGTVVGEHSVILAGAHERIVLTHISEDRGILAKGGVRAALWLHGQKPGLYGVADMLGLAV